MLPFLKNKHEGGVSMPVDVIERETDEGSDGFDMLDAVAQDFIDAIHAKDKKLLKSALEALLEHIQENDQVQDESFKHKGHEL